MYTHFEAISVVLLSVRFFPFQLCPSISAVWWRFLELLQSFNCLQVSSVALQKIMLTTSFVRLRVHVDRKECYRVLRVICRSVNNFLLLLLCCNGGIFC